jgi:hypothetical protein
MSDDKSTPGPDETRGRTAPPKVVRPTGGNRKEAGRTAPPKIPSRPPQDKKE